jgi:hypothetical protein
MKSKLFIIGVVVLLISSCATETRATIVYDELIALEETAWISTYNMGTIVKYNGEEVNWPASKKDELIQIPAGDTLLEWDIHSTIDNKYWSGKAVIRYNFQPQKQYYFFPGNYHFKTAIYLIIYDYGKKTYGQGGQWDDVVYLIYDTE